MPGRDNIGDVGLQTFQQVLPNKLQLNMIKLTNCRPKMAAFSLKTFRLFKKTWGVSSVQEKTFKEIGPFLGKLEAAFFQQANFGITLYTYYSLYRYIPRKNIYQLLLLLFGKKTLRCNCIHVYGHKMTW